MKPTVEGLVKDIGTTLERIASYLPKAGTLEKLLIPAEVGEILRIEIETLEAWRRKGIGPAFVKLGRDVRYRPSDLLRFVDLRVCRDTWQGKMRRLPDEAA